MENPQSFYNNRKIICPNCGREMIIIEEFLDYPRETGSVSSTAYEWVVASGAGAEYQCKNPECKKRMLIPPGSF